MNRWMASLTVALFGLTPIMGFAQGPGSGRGVEQAQFREFVPHPGDFQNWHEPGGDQTYYQLLPDDRGLRPRIDPALTNADIWIRFDYVLWSIKDPDRSLIGAPTSTTADLTGRDANNRLVAQDRINGARPSTFAIVPDTRNLNPTDLNGFRGTIGIPTRIGTFEAEGWVLQESVESITIDPFVDTGQVLPETLIPAVPLLDNGQISDTTMILFSESYKAAMKTKVMGTEANWIYPAVHPNRPIEFFPILGFRYLRVHDVFAVQGQDIPDPLNNPTVVLNHRITSRASNNVFGPQVGIRATTDLGRFNLGTELKLLLGLNKHKDRVATQQIFTVDELPTRDDETHTRFAPTLDVSAFARFHMTETFTLRVGYDLVIGENYSRAHDNIFYDAPASVTDPPTIRHDNTRTSFYITGISFGGEWEF